MSKFFKASANALSTTLPESRLKVAFVGMTVCGTGPLLVAAIGAYITAGADDTKSYNDVVAAWFFLMPIHELTFVPVFASVPKRLLKVAKDISSANAAHRGMVGGAKTPAQLEMDGFLTRLWWLHLFLIHVMIPSITIAMWSMCVSFSVCRARACRAGG